MNIQHRPQCWVPRAAGRKDVAMQGRGDAGSLTTYYYRVTRGTAPRGRGCLLCLLLTACCSLLTARCAYCPLPTAQPTAYCLLVLLTAHCDSHYNA